MRAAWITLGVGCAAVAIAVACTGSDPDPSQPPNVINNNFFGPDGSSSSSSSSSGAATSSSSSSSSSGGSSSSSGAIRPMGPRTIICPNGDHCPADTEVCCVSSEDAGTAHCTLKGQCEDGRPDIVWSIMGCDDAEDCKTGQLCCGATTAGVYWSSFCKDIVDGEPTCAERALCRDPKDCVGQRGGGNCFVPDPSLFYPSGFRICD